MVTEVVDKVLPKPSRSEPVPVQDNLDVRLIAVLAAPLDRNHGRLAMAATVVHLRPKTPCARKSTAQGRRPV